MKSRYSFEDCGTERQAEGQTDEWNQFRNVLSNKFQMIYDTPIKAERQLATRKTI